MQRLQDIKQQIQNNYQYTISGNKLTIEQRNFYEQNGYIIIPKLLEQKEIDKYVERFLEYCYRKREPYKGMVIMRDISLAKQKIQANSEQNVTKIQDWQEDPVLFEYLKHKKILDYVKDIIGPNVKSAHTMLINKPPNTGKTQRHPLHQDILYFPFGPSQKIVCAWTAMEKVNREKGGLVVYPGTHKLGMLKHGYPDWSQEGGVNRAYFGIMEVPSETTPRVYPEMEAGDTVFFHPHLIHGSGENKTQEFRKSISCHYASCECEYLQDLKGTQYEDVSKDVLDYSSKRYKLNSDFIGLWKLKSRLVCGQEFEGKF